MLFYEILCFSLVLARASAIPQRLVTSADTAGAVVVPANPNIAGLLPVSTLSPSSTQVSTSASRISTTTTPRPVDTSAKYSLPTSGCVLTTFPAENVTQVNISFESEKGAVSHNATYSLSATVNCICANGVMAAPWTDANTESGTQFVYCATSVDGPTYVYLGSLPQSHQLTYLSSRVRRPTESPVSTVTVCQHLACGASETSTDFFYPHHCRTRFAPHQKMPICGFP